MPAVAPMIWKDRKRNAAEASEIDSIPISYQSNLLDAVLFSLSIYFVWLMAKRNVSFQSLAHILFLSCEKYSAFLIGALIPLDTVRTLKIMYNEKNNF